MDNYTIDVLDARRDLDIKRWDAIVDKSALPDVYYRPGYVLAYREANTHAVCALLIDAAGFRVLMPMIVANLDMSMVGMVAPARYAYSAYGYGGLLPLDHLRPPNDEQMGALRAALQEWSQQSGVVCVVVRMHPMANQESWFDGYERDDAILRKGNATIAVNLEVWNDAEQSIASLTSERRRNLALARKKMSVVWTCGENEATSQALKVFQSLYNERMSSLGAGQFFFFADEYYNALARGLGRHLAIGLAMRSNEPVGGALFMADVGYAHYHLSASNDVGRKLNATTLLINAGALWARECGCKKLHLGGGVSEEDSLFRFKQTFGGIRFTYATLTVIADPAAFASLRDLPNAPWVFAMHSVESVQSASALSQ
jgi:hypothetical protein